MNSSERLVFKVSHRKANIIKSAGVNRDVTKTLIESHQKSSIIVISVNVMKSRHVYEGCSLNRGRGSRKMLKLLIQNIDTQKETRMALKQV